MPTPSLPLILLLAATSSAFAATTHQPATPAATPPATTPTTTPAATRPATPAAETTKPSPAPTKPLDTISPDQLMAIVRELAFKRSGWGDDEHRLGLDKARDLLTNRVKALGFTPTLQTIHWKRRENITPNPDRDMPDPASRDESKFNPYANIIFELPGTTLPREVIIVGAHFDAVPKTVAADDNATGVAGLLEIARVLKAHPHHRTIRFILFDLEEAGLIGAVQHVMLFRDAQEKLPDDQQEKIVGMLSLEMLGYYSDKPNSQRNPFRGIPGFPAGDMTGDFIAMTTTSAHSPFLRAMDKHMRAAEPELKTFLVDQFPIAPPDLLRSDHAPFLFAGFPAVMVTDTANFRNPNYHKPTDTPDSLNPPMFARTVRGLAAGIHALASPTASGPAITWTPAAPTPDAKPEPKPPAATPTEPTKKPTP